MILRRPVAIPTALPLAILALVALFATRAAFRPSTLDDLDSTNFHAGVLSYSPPSHRPHPPGFPVFIAAAKGVNAIVDSPVDALTLLSALSSTLAALPLYFIGRSLFGGGTAGVAAVLACFTPMVWFVGVRPMSDASGLLAGTAAQALLLGGLREQGRRGLWLGGAAAAGLAIGVRLQAVWLVMPLFLFGWIVRRRHPVAGPAVLGVAVLAWFVPMVWLSGGWEAYRSAFRMVMTEAASWEPLLSRPTSGRALHGLWYLFIAPWSVPQLAIPVLLAATAGVLRAWRSDRSALGLLLLLFLPYTVFHYVVHNAPAVRYAVPFVPLVAVPAAYALTSWGRTWPAVAGTAAFVVAAGAVTLPALRAYSQEESPVFQAMRRAGMSRVQPAVISGTGVFYRYLAFAPRPLRIITPEGGLGWSRVTDYWLSGGDGPAYFLTTDERLDRLTHADAQMDLGHWQWSPRVRRFMTGERPNVVRLVRVETPLWFLRRLRFEPAGRRIARIQAFVRGDWEAHDVLIEGTSSLDAPQRFVLRVDGGVHDVSVAQRSFALQSRIEGREGYATLQIEGEGMLTVTSVLAPRIADAMLGPSRGMRRDQTGADARWLEAVASILLHVPPFGATLRIEGTVDEVSPLPTLAVIWAGEPLQSHVITGRAFSLDVWLEASARPWAELGLKTSYVSDPSLNEEGLEVQRQPLRLTRLALTPP